MLVMGEGEEEEEKKVRVGKTYSNTFMQRQFPLGEIQGQVCQGGEVGVFGFFLVAIFVQEFCPLVRYVVVWVLAVACRWSGVAAESEVDFSDQA